MRIQFLLFASVLGCEFQLFLLLLLLLTGAVKSSVSYDHPAEPSVPPASSAEVTPPTPPSSARENRHTEG